SLLQTLPGWSWLEAETVGEKRENPPAPTSAPASASVPVPVPTSVPPPASASVSAAGERDKGGEKGTEGEGKEEGGEEGGQTNLPLPSLRIRNLCPFELRRYKLACRGRELDREVDCPLGCGEKVRHFGLRFHVRSVCQARTVACRFSHCPALFPLRDRDRHEQQECRLIFERSSVLGKATLQNEMLPCQLCSEPVRLRDTQLHEREQCAFRLVACPRLDCGWGGSREPCIPWHLLASHLSGECDSQSARQRVLQVHRARSRTNYPRPWGIRIDIDLPPALDASAPEEALPPDAV
ncbi:hypothetical protein B484DRAFT_402341, partial [Ochromonadaceae sp. CCMP2298]